MGGECCGGALAYVEPDKSRDMSKGITEAPYGTGAYMTAPPPAQPAR